MSEQKYSERLILAVKLPMREDIIAEVKALEAKPEVMERLLRRIRAWHMLNPSDGTDIGQGAGAGDAAYWRAEIDSILPAADQQEQEDE